MSMLDACARFHTCDEDHTNVSWRRASHRLHPQRARPESLFAQTSRRFKRSKTALVGLAIVLCLVVVAIFADVLAPYQPIRLSPTEMYQTPSDKHFLGTDQFGRDMLSRIIHGSRVSLAVGLSSVVLAGNFCRRAPRRHRRLLWGEN
jgi:ABC-type dipeptide/oligopeptide/nickel transport system permease subunit